MTGPQPNACNISTPANIVTIVRILLIPVFIIVMLAPWPSWLPEPSLATQLKPWLAAAVFTLLAASDGIDGYLARSRGEVTTFGKFLDPIADKILVAAALLALVELGKLPAWIVLIILGREFLVSGLRMVAAAGGQVIAASVWGKLKTVLQIISVVAFIVQDSLIDWLGSYFGAWSTMLVNVFVWLLLTVTLIVTLASLVDYLINSADVLGFDSNGRRRFSRSIFAKRSPELDAENIVATVAAPDGEAATVAAPDGEAATVATPAGEAIPADSSSAGEDVAAASVAAWDDGSGSAAASPSTNLPVTAISSQLAAVSRAVLELAQTQGWHVATAESCTGGLVAAALTEIPGASEVVWGGVVSYDNSVKQQILGVSANILATDGAVSAACVQQMSEGVRAALAVDFAVATSGIAGPGGGTPDKPVGTVWLAVAGPCGNTTHLGHFSGERSDIRAQATLAALQLLWQTMSEMSSELASRQEVR